VSHHPPVTAFHASSPADMPSFSFFGSNNTKSKFTGKSITFSQTGKNYVRLNKGELYSCEKPNMYACNLIIGTEYVDIGGKVLLTCEQTKLTCAIEFQRKGWNAKTQYNVEGKVLNSQG